jgi:hypothetical protein
MILANQIDTNGRTREEAERVLNEILTRLPLPG